MGKVTGFLEYERLEEGYEPVAKRVKNYREFVIGLNAEQAKQQGARCMDCGTPFCNSGCPVNNIIPDFNDLVYRGDWKNAALVLHSTNNFPEFTGRICPAPCEAACTLNVNDDPVGIKSIEHAIIDRAWAEGWVVPQPPKARTGKKVAVVGSGPARLAAAQQLARAGHDVTVFEKNSRIGGLLRYGIPDFKMEKTHIDRRIEQMQAEGVTFRTGVLVGACPADSKVTNDAKQTIGADALKAQFDAVLLTGGAEQSRDLPVPGRELDGVHFAMEFLPQQNKVVAGDKLKGQLMATGKHVIVIGGGDTGSDCVGTSNRHGASQRDPVRTAAATAGGREPAHDLALLANQVAHQFEPRRRLPARICDRDQGIHRREGPCHRPDDGACAVAGRQDDRGAGQRADIEGRSGAAGDGIREPGRRQCSRPSASSATTAAMPRPARMRSAAIAPMSTESLLPATCVAGRAWWSGPSAKAGRRHEPSMRR